jgi:hypothetical protein
MAEFPAPKEGILVTHFVVSNDVERSRRFYMEVLGGELVLDGEPSIVALANGWVTIGVGGVPTAVHDKATLRTAGLRPRRRRELLPRGVDLVAGPAWTTTGPGRSPARDRQAAGWLKVATSRPNASMWSLIEKATTAPRVVAGRPRLGTSSAKTVNR